MPEHPTHLTLEWNSDDEVCVDGGVWRSATPVELALRDAARACLPHLAYALGVSGCAPHRDTVARVQRLRDLLDA